MVEVGGTFQRRVRGKQIFFASIQETHWARLSNNLDLLLDILTQHFLLLDLINQLCDLELKASWVSKRDQLWRIEKSCY